LGEFDGVKVNNGGFGSAIALVPGSRTDFYLLTDRGPNYDTIGTTQKGFPIPNFTPQIGRFRLNGSTLTQVGVIEIKDPTGKNITGRPNPVGMGATGEKAVDIDGNSLSEDPYGLDPEGLVALADGTFWLSDEYGPHLVHLDATGKEIERINPFGSGTGGRTLPKVLAKRRANRGMEALTITPDGKTLVGIVQSQLDNPTTAVRTTSRAVRVIAFDLATASTKQYVYLLDSAPMVVSEIAAITNTSFLVIERDQLFPGDTKAAPATLKAIYKIDIGGATDISDPANSDNGKKVGEKTIEQLTVDELRAAGITPVTKELTVDMLKIPGGFPHDKLEGLAIIDANTIVVSNDDDFGISSAGGKLVAKLLPMTGQVDNSVVRFIKLDKSLH
jgi:hypothetical protein